MLEQQTKLSAHAFDVRNATQFAEDLASDGNDVEILALVGILLRRFDYCYKSNAPFETKFVDSLRFLSDVRAPETQRQNNIPMYGIIATRVNYKNNKHRKSQNHSVLFNYVGHSDCGGEILFTKRRWANNIACFSQNRADGHIERHGWASSVPRRTHVDRWCEIYRRFVPKSTSEGHTTA